MPYSEPVGEEKVWGGLYSATFRSTVDPVVRVEVRLMEGDGGPFFGDDSDALMQDIIDRLSPSPLLDLVDARREWPQYRIITPTPDESS